MSPVVSVVIPAFNEEDVLPATLSALRSLPFVAEIVVVDDGSGDGTAAAAAGPKTTVLRQRRNLGKGDALQRGVAAAKGDVVLLLDADLGGTAAAAEDLIGPLLRDEADLVIGSFRGTGPGGFGLVQSLARAGLRRLAGLTAASPLSGQRAFHRRVLRAAPRFARGFGAEVAFTIDVARGGFRVREVPVAMAHRETGRNAAGFLHRGRQMWDVVGALLPRVLTAGGPEEGSAEEGSRR